MCECHCHAARLRDFDIGFTLRTLYLLGVLSVRCFQVGDPVEEAGMVSSEGAGAGRDPFRVHGVVFGFIREAYPAFAGFGGGRLG